MSYNNRTLRINTGILDGNASIPVNIEQDVDTFEILSLNINSKNFYKLHTSKYGCIVGRVLANEGVGIPNAKVSVFVEAKPEYNSDSVISELYPYTSVNSKNSDMVRYNLLPDESVSDCHAPIGTMPSKRMILDDDNMVEVYDNYYKFTTVTNKSGDYMIFGVPVGDHTVHTDIDLSDIGFLSQRPRDMVYKGYNITQFENANKFKSSTNLDSLTQVISQNDSVNVVPFWGEYGDDNTDMPIGITRNDISIQYEFTPTCVFMGSLVTDTDSEGVSRKCIASERMGKMDRLTTGAGTIEMIRKTPDGAVEEFQVQGTQLIDGTGTWCYQIPMNLDYMKMDEYGNMIPSDDPKKGIPTRTMVRFRISLNDFESNFGKNHISKVLVPNNPTRNESDDDSMRKIYNFGSLTPDDCFRELFWNNVYTVKSFIPRIQKGNSQNNRRFTGFKAVNVNGSNNPIPYNNMRVKLTFMFKLQCAILKVLIKFVEFLNGSIFNIWLIRKWCTCIVVGDGMCPDLDGWYFAPGCKTGHKPWKHALSNIIDKHFDTKSVDDINKDDNEVICLTNQADYLMECVEMNLAQEYEVINFDFYNDWLNGVIYIPHWFGRIMKKRKHLFGKKRKTVHSEMQFCSENYYNIRRYTQQCALTYKGDSGSTYYSEVITNNGCAAKGQKCHMKAGRKYAKIFKKGTVRHGGGLARAQETTRGETVYYFKPCEWHKSYDGTYENKCILFATDIVLLGSLNECDENGIPDAYKYLSSSSYLMPTNLAKTNMDEEGYMYGLSGSNKSICYNKKTTEPIDIKKDTFSNFVEWSKNKDYYEKSPDDVTEYEVTEAAGISWGYTGPNQDGEQFNGNYDKDKDIYNPGGHFINMACSDKNTMTNIKSCVNLSRICEVGSSMSSREYIVLRDGDDFKFSYIQPNGLISKDELLEGASFREMFATMNINSLRTTIDENTGYRRYEFISAKPNNFSGELRNKIGYYNNFKPKADDMDGRTGEKARLFVRSLEDFSRDYYHFRFGLTETPKTKEMMKHYLIYNISDDTVALPMYENSFYFYFGLINGSSALDKFYDNFYAECDKNKNDVPYFTYDTENADYCNSRNGSLDIHFSDEIEAPFQLSMDMSGAKLYFYEEIVKNEKHVRAVKDEAYRVFYYDNDNNLRTEYVNKETYNAKKNLNGDTVEYLKIGEGGKDYNLSDVYYTNSMDVHITDLYGTLNGMQYNVHVESNDGESKDFSFDMYVNTPVLSGIAVNSKSFNFNVDEYDIEYMYEYYNTIIDAATEQGKKKVKALDKDITFEEENRDPNSSGEGVTKVEFTKPWFDFPVEVEKDFLKDTENTDYEENGFNINDCGGITIDGYSRYKSDNGNGIIGFIIATDNECEYIQVVESGDITDNDIAELFDLNSGQSKPTILGKKKVLDDKRIMSMAWEGNNDYNVYAVYRCPDYKYTDGDAVYMTSESKLSLLKLITCSIKAPIPLDIYIYDNDLRYNKTIKKFINNFDTCNRGNWWAFLLYYFDCEDDKWQEKDKVYVYVDISKALLSTSDHYLTKEEKNGVYYKYVTTISKKQIWNIKKALYYTESLYEPESVQSIKVGATGGTGVYKEYVYGTMEREFSNDSDDDEVIYKDVLNSVRAYITKGAYENTSIGKKPDYVYDSENYPDYVLSYKNIILPTLGFNMAYGNYHSKKDRRVGLVRPNYNDYSFTVDGKRDEYVLYKYGANNKYGILSQYKGETYAINGPKLDYGVSFVDSDNARVPDVVAGDTSDFIADKRIKGVDQRVFLPVPSVYMPFFFNTCFIIDEDNRISCNYCINNGITRDGRFSEVNLLINGTVFNSNGNKGGDTTYGRKKHGDVASYGDNGYDDSSDHTYGLISYYNRNDIEYGNNPYRYRSGTNVKYEYSCYNSYVKNHLNLSGFTYNVGDTNVFSFSVEDIDMTDNGAANVISESLNITFPSSGDFSFTNNMVFCYVSSDNIEILKNVNNFGRTFAYFGNLYNGKGITKPFKEEDPLFKNFNGCTSTFIGRCVHSSTIDERINHYINDSGMTANTLVNRIFGGDSSGYIVAISEPLTRSFDYREEFVKGEEGKDKMNHLVYDYIKKDGNILSVIKIYRYDEFKNIIDGVFGDIENNGENN